MDMEKIFDFISNAQKEIQDPSDIPEIDVCKPPKFKIISEQRLKKPLESLIQNEIKTTGSKLLAAKAEKIEQNNLYDISPKKLATVLTHLDLKLYRGIKPIELVVYKGTEESISRCEGILALKSRNSALSSFVSNELYSNPDKFNHFNKLATFLLKIKNYNSLMNVIAGLRANHLGKDELKKLTKILKQVGDRIELNEIMENSQIKKELFVWPFEFFLKDIATSNLAIGNPIASMNFCKLVDIFVYLQNIEFDKKFSLVHEHIIIYKLNSTKLAELSDIAYENEEECVQFILWDI